MTPTGIFITGTDTGVGKTTVAVAIIRLALRRGYMPIPYKPVETGCDPHAEDARRLWAAAGKPVALTDVCPFPLTLPAAPAAAADAIGLELRAEDLVRRGTELARHGNLLVVEGAGGLLVPYAEGCTNADLAAGLRLPVLVVARTALGTINHVALTLAELERRRLRLAGLLLVRSAAVSAPHESSNDRLIEKLTGVRPLATLPYLGEPDRSDPDRLADVLAPLLTASALLRLVADAR